jgi:hypothetical protein
MSWDIYIQDLPPMATMAEVPVDFVPEPIGEREYLVKRIIDVFPMADRQDKDWLFVRSGDMDISIQVYMEDAVQVRYLLVHVHGGEHSAQGIAALLGHLGLRAIDTATGEIFDGDTLDEAL